MRKQILALFAVLSAATLAGSTLTSVSTQASGFLPAAPCNDSNSILSGCVSAFGSPGGMNRSTASAAAEASHNSLMVSVSGGAAGMTMSSANALASFSETLLFHGSGQGMFEYTLSLAGHASGSLVNAYGTLNGQAVTALNREMTFRQAFTYETPFEFAVTLQVGGVSFAGWQGDAGSLLLSAAVSSVRVIGAGGAAPQGFSYRDTRATNEAFAEMENPEPGTWLLAGTALVLLPWLARRRRGRTAVDH